MGTPSQESSTNLVHHILNHESSPVVMWSTTDPLVVSMYFWLRDMGSDHMVRDGESNMKLSPEADKLLRNHRGVVKRLTRLNRKNKHEDRRQDRQGRYIHHDTTQLLWYGGERYAYRGC